MKHIIFCLFVAILLLPTVHADRVDLNPLTSEQVFGKVRFGGPVGGVQLDGVAPGISYQVVFAQQQNTTNVLLRELSTFEATPRKARFNYRLGAGDYSGRFLVYKLDPIELVAESPTVSFSLRK